jgi:hypothetical protein
MCCSESEMFAIADLDRVAFGRFHDLRVYAAALTDACFEGADLAERVEEGGAGALGEGGRDLIGGEIRVDRAAEGAEGVFDREKV